MKKLFFTLLMSFAILPFYSNGQWASDPAENIPAVTFGDSHAIPKIHADFNGNYYVAMFSNENNYNIRVQRLDSEGNYLWDSDGILVSDHTQNSWISEWDMRVDNAGNCIVAFADIRSGNPDIYAYKISPEGEFLWGDDGIALSPNPAEEFAPFLCVTEDDNVYVTWSRPGDPVAATIVQRIAPDGSLPWGTEAMVYTGSQSYTGPRVVGAGNDFVLAFYKETGPSWSPTRHIYAQKFNNEAETLWSDDVLVSDKPGISGWTDMEVLSDDAQGILIACSDDRDGNDLGNAFVSHVPTDGNMIWPVGGVELGTEVSQFHSDAQIGGMNSNGDVYAAWTFKDFNQSFSGVKAQKISQDGIRQWTDQGTTITGLNDPYATVIGCNMEDDITYVVFDKNDQSGNVNSTIYGQAVNSDGTIAWNQDAVISTRESEKVHPMLSEINQEQMIVGWEDRLGGDIVRVQNLNLNGTIGDGELSDVATLSDLTVDDETVEGFSTTTYEYTVVRSHEAPLPVVDAIASDANATVEITQTTEVPGDATVVVTAQDGVTVLTYTIHFDSDIAVNQSKENTIKVYPNPAESNLNVESKDQIHTVEILDLSGRVVKAYDNLQSTELSINIGILKKGTYLIRINHTQISKLIKQ